MTRCCPRRAGSPRDSRQLVFRVRTHSRSRRQCRCPRPGPSSTVRRASHESIALRLVSPIRVLRSRYASRCASSDGKSVIRLISSVGASANGSITSYPRSVSTLVSLLDRRGPFQRNRVGRRDTGGFAKTWLLISSVWSGRSGLPALNGHGLDFGESAHNREEHILSGSR
jgi:hypothetical protein